MKRFLCVFTFLFLSLSGVHAQSSSPGDAVSTKLTATYSKGVISLSDGRHLKVKKGNVKGFSGGWFATYVVMNDPTGAHATITYDNNSESFKSEVPFSYKVIDNDNKDSYFKLTVDEGGPDKTWSVRLQNEGGKQITIELLP